MAGRETVLILNDDVALNECLRYVLKWNYEIIIACDEEEALAILNRREIDLVMLDLNLPGLSGIAVMKAIKRLKPDTEVIMVSGDGCLADAREAIRCGAEYFISKPLCIPDLIITVSKCLEKKRRNRNISNFIHKIKTLRSSVDTDEENRICPS